MIIGWSSKCVQKDSVFSSFDETTTLYWIIEKIEVHPSFPGWPNFHMREIDAKTWQSTDNTFQCSKEYFLDGSGFGGGPYLREDGWYKHLNGIIYREIA